jgi:hypothetical protein
MRISRSIVGMGIAALAVQLGACANTSKTQAKTTPPQNTAVANCPLAMVPGVRTMVQDIPEGVQIVAVGPEGQVDTIRQNVRAMATTNNNQGDPFAPCSCALEAPGATESMPSSTPYATLQAARLIPLSSATVEQIPSGGILKLSAKDPNQVSALRTRTREEVSALRNCLYNAEQKQH